MKDLSPLEQRLVRCVEEGGVLDLTNGRRRSSAEEMVAWGSDRTIRAAVIRDILRGKLAGDPDPNGIRVRGVRIDGALDLRHIASAVPLSLWTCYFSSGGDFSHASLKSVDLRRCRVGQLRFSGAQIGGQLSLADSIIGNTAETALSAEGIQVRGDLLLNDGFTAISSGTGAATVLLTGARIGGQLDIADSTIKHATNTALLADILRVDGDLILDRAIIASDSDESPAVGLRGAHVGGRLYATAATVTNGAGAALAADYLQVNGDSLLNDGFTATGAGEKGAVRLGGAKVGGQLTFSGATITNSTGGALVAEGLEVTGTVWLDEGFTATGYGGDGAVRLRVARLGGLDADSATLSNDDGPALSADSLLVTGNLFLDDGFTATSGNHAASVVLSDARVDGFFIDLTGLKKKSGEDGTIHIDGLVYSGFPNWMTVLEWLAAISYRTPWYSAQPYQQLAAATRAAGHDGDTRKILMAQRRDQVRREAITAFPERTWAKVTGIFLGYGYQPWRALLYLFTVLFAAIALTIGIGGHFDGLAHTTRTASPGSACTTVEQIGVGIDLGLPLIKTTARETCTTIQNTAGQIITAAGWVLQALAWALATLFIAGFTGAVRKT